jgi:triacylglycerol lipase
VPYLVSLAELDPEMFHVQAGKLMDAACSAGRCPPFLLLKDHGHMSEVYAINTSDAAFGDGVLEFIASLPDAGSAAK